MEEIKIKATSVSNVNGLLRKVETIERGERYGVGPIAIFQFKEGVKDWIYVYARMINNKVHIARRDMKFFPFTQDSPVTIIGYTDPSMLTGPKEVRFSVKNLYTEDNGYTFILEYEKML